MRHLGLLITSLLVACSDGSSNASTPDASTPTPDAGADATTDAPPDSGTPVACEDLAALSLESTVITTAELVPAGTFTLPEITFEDFPAFCRIAARIGPAINFELWLPTTTHNGKLYVAGNGGMAGAISYASMGNALRLGYATASTDTGHTVSNGFDASWALGRPDLIEDFGHRAIHAMTVRAKTIIQQHYAAHPTHSYFVGCSKGGQQALMAAQRYPEDFDGIIAGNPANDWTRFYAGGHLWYSHATLLDPESYIPTEKVPLIEEAVNTACDALDGVTDGVLEDPRDCTFDPDSLICAPAQDPDTCFTPKQAQALKDIWNGARTSSGELVYPGLVPGGEASAGFGIWISGPAPMQSLHFFAANDFFRFMVFDDPDWDFRTFDFDTDVQLAIDKVGAALDANDPNLQPFKDAGGKLIVYHGFSDPDISPLASIDYYESVRDTLGGQANVEDFYRLFMVPGLGHCVGGPGPTSLDPFPELEAWVENEIAPDTIIGKRPVAGVVESTRLLCPYPRKAAYDGSGDPTSAESFDCVVP